MSAPPGAIVVGVDGSADSDRALEWAAAAGSQRRAGLHLVHALPQPPYAVPYPTAEEEQHRDFAQRLLGEARARVEPWACRSPSRSSTRWPLQRCWAPVNTQ